MKKLLVTPLLFLHLISGFAQVQLSGKVVDAISRAELGGATISCQALGTIQASESGNFDFGKTRPGSFSIRVSSVGYRTLDTLIRPQQAGVLIISLVRINLFMQPVEIKALRASDKSPFSKTNLSKQDIAKANLGQDLPFLLNQTPSVVINSDAGNGVGYTGIYIRGTDATRINMTLNGIPYNDAESQSIYFVDLPDLASSVNSIQVQRGVGTSSNGAGAFGATINFSTNEYNDKAYAEINNTFGSFNTWKNTVKLGSGLIEGHFLFDVRLSSITSDGFIDRASSNLKSIYLSTAYLTKKSSLRLNAILGMEKTYQAWNGIPEAKVKGNLPGLLTHYQNNQGSLYNSQNDSLNLFNSNPRTYNYFTYPNQTDDYQQDHYQLFYNHQFDQYLSVNAAGFLSRGIGYYEEYKSQESYSAYGLSGPVLGTDTLTNTDLIRQRWLDNYFYGAIYSLQYKKFGTQLSLGGGFNRYDGSHHGNVIWTANGGIPAGNAYYQNNAFKTDLNFYGKWQQTFANNWNFFADLQYRQVHYRINGFDDNPAVRADQQYRFFNPKVGLFYAKNDWQAYLSYSQASHEPNRDDFEANRQDQPRPETLHDLEISLRRKKAIYNWAVTGYFMQYTSQLVLTGKINDVGSYTRTNIAGSYRFGLELEGAVKPAAWIALDANLTLSQNKVIDFTEFIDDYDNGGQKTNSYRQTDIAFSPAVVGAAGLHIYPFRHVECSLFAKYVGREYLDNTQKTDRSLDAYIVQNLRAAYTLPFGGSHQIDFILQVNNLFNKKYEPNGYTYSYWYQQRLVTENFLFPMAGTNALLAVNIKF